MFGTGEVSVVFCSSSLKLVLPCVVEETIVYTMFLIVGDNWVDLSPVGDSGALDASTQ
jgi:hypothetical protein